MRYSFADLWIRQFDRGEDQPRRHHGASFRAKIGIAVLSIATLSFGDTSADTITLTPIADTSLFEYVPDNNLGGLTDVAAGTIRLLKRSRGLFKFDLTQVPSSATITSAAFDIQVVKVPPSPLGSIFSLNRVLRDWGEGNGAGTMLGSPATAGQATWNNRFHPSTPWTPPGGGADVDYVGAFSATNFINGFGPYTFNSTTGLVADVQAWLNDPSTNFGWMLISEREASRETVRRFGSREDPSHAPVLVIGFVVGPKIVTQPQSQTVQVDSTVSFSVAVSGAPPFTYQWQYNDITISGATTNPLMLPNVQTNAAGQYNVLVTDQNGTTASDHAVLTVIPPGSPFVSIIDPTNEARFPDGSQVLVTAEAGETNGSISQVEFFLNATNSVGVSLTNPATNLYTTLLTNVAAGSYALTAVATDPRTNAVTSSVVRISFVAPPIVTVSVSPSGTNFLLGTILTNTAQVSPSVTNVEFFEATNLLGTVGEAPFSLVWTPAEARLYSLTAQATDDLGQAGTSPPVVIRIHGPDSVAPRIAITNAPANFARLYTNRVCLAGTASDANLDHVEYQITSGPFLDPPAPAAYAEGTSNWMAIVTLQPGQNQVRLRSIDFSTNSSPTLSRFYTYVVPASLVIQTNGAGTVSPDLTHKMLELGQLYTVTARPARGFVFQSWEGEGLAVTNNATLSFVLTNGMTLVANFVTNPFPVVAGAYQGVFFDTNKAALGPFDMFTESAGSLSLQLRPNGSFSAKLAMKGTSFSFSGQFDPSGRATVPVLRRPYLPAVCSLQLDLSGGTGLLTGQVTNALGTEVLVSPVFAGKSFNSKTNPAPQAGGRGFILITNVNNALVAPLVAANSSDLNTNKIGSGSASISMAGAVKVQGRWINNNSFALASALFQTDFNGGNLPFYLSYFGGTEIIIGLPRFGADTNDISGTLWWVKSGTNGFSRQMEMLPPSR